MWPPQHLQCQKMIKVLQEAAVITVQTFDSVVQQMCCVTDGASSAEAFERVTIRASLSFEAIKITGRRFVDLYY